MTGEVHNSHQVMQPSRHMVWIVLMLFLSGCGDMNDSIEQVKRLGEKIIKVAVVVEESCGHKPRVAYSANNKRIHHIKLVFSQDAKLTCTDQQLLRVVDDYFAGVAAYASNTPVVIEYMGDEPQNIRR